MMKVREMELNSRSAQGKNKARVEMPAESESECWIIGLSGNGMRSEGLQAER